MLPYAHVALLFHKVWVTRHHRGGGGGGARGGRVCACVRYVLGVEGWEGEEVTTVGGEEVGIEEVPTRPPPMASILL